MKKKIVVVSLFFLLVLVISACGKLNNNNSKEEASTTLSGSNFRRSDFGQPEREADLRGVVKSIVGNEAVILKMEASVNRVGVSTSSEEIKEKKTTTLSLNGMTGGGPGGGRMMPGGGPGSIGEVGDRADMIETLKELSSGEETIIIPVGIKMLKIDSSSETEKREMVSATLEDIKADKMITVWLNEEVGDKKVADFILIN